MKNVLDKYELNKMRSSESFLAGAYLETLNEMCNRLNVLKLLILSGLKVPVQGKNTMF